MKTTKNKMRCKHPPSKRREGPRVSRPTWGTSSTQICTCCWWWRTMRYPPGRWQRAEKLVEALCEWRKGVE